jgi:hypothetical protein
VSKLSFNDNPSASKKVENNLLETANLDDYGKLAMWLLTHLNRLIAQAALESAQSVDYYPDREL